MPAKYHIHIQPTAPRFPAHGKGTVLDWGEGCIRCTRCVKEICPYDAFDQRGFDRTSSPTPSTASARTATAASRAAPGSWSKRP